MKYYEKFIISILNKGPIPKHIAFIMDGNRRFAVKAGKRKIEGHPMGFESLKKCLEWCLELGVLVVSLYAFSIDNLGREKEEVDILMSLARDKLKEISENNAFLQKNGICVKVIGKLELAPKDVQETMEFVMQRTKQNTKLRLNICFCYDSTYELEKATESYNKTLKSGLEQEIQSPKNTLISHLLIKDEPDILVRTSCETRISNFMLPQCSTSIVCFLKEMWPEMTIMSILKIILKYQLQEKELKQLRNHLDNYDRKSLEVKK